MKPNQMLTITSLLLIALTIAHLAQDVAYGYEPGNINNLLVVPIAVVWLYGTLMLAGRRTGTLSPCSSRCFRWSFRSSTRKGKVLALRAVWRTPPDTSSSSILSF